MARICYIFREKEKNEHSIELVFDTVTDEIARKGHQIYKWYKPVSWRKTFREIRALRKQKFDLYHITGDVNYLWLFFPWRKTTMTIHDIGMFKNNPLSMKRLVFAILSFIAPAFILKRLTCVSTLTADDLTNRLHLPSSKIRVIHNPLVLDIHPSAKDFDQAHPIILQLGTGHHKNLDTLIESVAGLSCRLEIVGNPDQSLISRMGELGIDYNISSKLTNEEIINKYRQCDILFFVSRSEGFGLPILEAQATGRPVLTGRARPMCDVAADGALLFDDDDVSGIRSGILALCKNPALRDDVVNKGFNNIKRFQRSKIADDYLAFYSENFKI